MMCLFYVRIGDCPYGEQMRFFEHTDAGSITLLIFDEEGLEVIC